MPTVVFEVKVPVKIKKKAKVYVSSCSVLDVHSQGKTEAEAKKNLLEALRLFFFTCFERGTLEAVLSECGFRPIRKAVKVPKDHSFMTVPLPFNVKGHCAPECHA